MKKFNLLLLIAFLLSSCAPAATVTAIFTSTPTQTLTPIPTATETPSPTPTIIPTPTQIGGGSGKFIFELTKADFSKPFPDLKGDQNVFIANADGTGLIPITNGLNGYNYLESVSPDGTKVLISSGSNQYFTNPKFTNLYSIDLKSLGSEPKELSALLPSRNNFSGQIAKWIDNTRLIYIGQGEAGFGIYAVNGNGTDPSNIYKYNNDAEANKPVQILAINGTRVYWRSQTSKGNDGKDLPWWSNLDGSGYGPLNLNGKQFAFSRVFTPLIFSPDGGEVAWMDWAKQLTDSNYLRIASPNAMDSTRQLVIPVGYSFPTIKWSPDSSTLLVIDQNYVQQARTNTYYDMKSDLFGLYTISVQSMIVTNKHRSDVLDTLAPPNSNCLTVLGGLSPDGKQLIVSLPIDEKDCKSKVSLLNMETMTLSDVLNGITFSDLRYRYNDDDGVYWLP